MFLTDWQDIDIIQPEEKEPLMFRNKKGTYVGFYEKGKFKSVDKTFPAAGEWKYIIFDNREAQEFPKSDSELVVTFDDYLKGMPVRAIFIDDIDKVSEIAEKTEIDANFFVEVEDPALTDFEKYAPWDMVYHWAYWDELQDEYDAAKAYLESKLRVLKENHSNFLEDEDFIQMKKILRRSLIESGPEYPASRIAAGVASKIKDPMKAAARFVAGLKLSDLTFDGFINYLDSIEESPKAKYILKDNFYFDDYFYFDPKITKSEKTYMILTPFYKKALELGISPNKIKMLCKLAKDISIS